MKIMLINNFANLALFLNVNFLSNLLKRMTAGFSVKEIIDILIIAFIIYEILLLIKRTRSFLIVNGLIIVVAIYLLSQLFNLQLTRSLFQTFFAFFVVILIVIFQKEIRNFFEYLPGLSRMLYQKKKLAATIRESFFQAVEELADKKIGALIVLSGRQEVGRYLEGGVNLDGNFSRALMLSIFDPTSPGHDGAVIIEGDKIKKFATHLPLSSRFIDDLGTRHRAGVGLTEHCDALVIIISEERGTISLAYQGKLRIVNREELKAEVNKFLSEKVFKPKNSNWHRIFTVNLKEKILAVILSFLFWLVFVFQTTLIQTKFELPIEFFLPSPDYKITQISPLKVSVTFSGAKKDFDKLDPEKLKILINLSDTKEGRQKIDITAKFISYPPYFSLIDFTPKTVSLTIQKAE